MNDAGQERWEAHLKECADKAMDVFGMGLPSHYLRLAMQDDDVIASFFLVQAAEARDILREVARLTPTPDDRLPPEGSTRISVPNQLIRRACGHLHNWDRDCPMELGDHAPRNENEARRLARQQVLAGVSRPKILRMLSQHGLRGGAALEFIDRIEQDAKRRF